MSVTAIVELSAGHAPPSHSIQLTPSCHADQSVGSGGEPAHCSDTVEHQPLQSACQLAAAALIACANACLRQSMLASLALTVRQYGTPPSGTVHGLPSGSHADAGEVSRIGST